MKDGGEVILLGNRTVTEVQIGILFKTLEDRFIKNMHRHPSLVWSNVETKLQANPEKMWSLLQMEETGGEPDVVFYDMEADKFVFFDCSPETPKGRRSICYDREALESRRENKPKTSAMDMATEMGIEILTETQYRDLQAIESMDTKTSSWVNTPEKIRKLGGALFCDRRYDTVFVYHNGAESYYSVRGFRGVLRV